MGTLKPTLWEKVCRLTGVSGETNKKPYKRGVTKGYFMVN